MELDNEFVQMVRETYRPQLITALQDTETVVQQFFTTIPGTGKQVVMDGIGTTEMVPRQHRLEQKQLDTELLYGRRCLHGNMWRSTLVKSNDDDLTRAAFAANIADFIGEQRNALTRIYDATALGTVYSEELRDYIIKPAYDPSANPTDPTAMFYKNSAGEGLMGTNWTGENLNIPEKLPMQPVLADGSIATSYTDFDTADNIDYAKSNVIPSLFVRTGTPTASGLTLEKIMTAGIMLESRHAMTSGEMYCMAITPQQKADLIMMDKLQNGQYGFQSIKNGMVSELLGIKFLVTNKVPIVNVGTEEDPHYVRACPVWRPKDAVFATWMNPKFDVVEHKESYYDLISSTVQVAIGAARKRVENVLTVHCEEGGLARLNS